MVIDIEKQIPDTVEQETAYERYKMFGGDLSETSYKILEQYAKTLELHNLKDPTINQAKNHSNSNNINFTKSLIITYGILREGHLKGYGEEFDDFETISDQKIFAEALLIEGRFEDYKLFVDKHLNTSKKEKDIP